MSVQSITNDVIRQQLTKDAIPETPVQDGMRCILAELVLVEKHCQHLGCLVEELSLYKEKLRRSIQCTTKKRSRPQRSKRTGWMIEREPSIYGRRHKDSLIPPAVGDQVHFPSGGPVSRSTIHPLRRITTWTVHPSSPDISTALHMGNPRPYPSPWSLELAWRRHRTAIIVVQVPLRTGAR